MALFKKAFIWSLSVAEAGEAYINFERIVAWKMVCSRSSHKPLYRRARRANRDWLHDVRRSEM